MLVTISGAKLVELELEQAAAEPDAIEETLGHVVRRRQHFRRLDLGPVGKEPVSESPTDVDIETEHRTSDHAAWNADCQARTASGGVSGSTSQRDSASQDVGCASPALGSGTIADPACVGVA
jgi:hypothetical protein